MEKLRSDQSQSRCSCSSLPTLQFCSKELVSNIYLKAVSTYDQFSVWAILFWSAFIIFIRDIAQVSIVETTWDSFINRMWRTFLPLKTPLKIRQFQVSFYSDKRNQVVQTDMDHQSKLLLLFGSSSTRHHRRHRHGVHGLGRRRRTLSEITITLTRLFILHNRTWPGQEPSWRGKRTQN